ncbi:MAG: hypothetical protein QF805_12805, partial [Pirellulaceae bacterium]|nr:hypothetical protein [Pirellulaceae bacterium]
TGEAPPYSWMLVAADNPLVRYRSPSVWGSRPSPPIIIGHGLPGGFRAFWDGHGRRSIHT